MVKRAKNNDRRVQQPDAAEESRERRMARLALTPEAAGAALACAFNKSTFGETEFSATYELLVERARAVRANDLSSAEDMLSAQAAALNALFLELARRSGVNMGEYMNAADRYMRLALKAQSQCRATLETLAAIKNPPVIIARQANIAAGPQQVNNGSGSAAPRAGNSESMPNGLLEANGGAGERLDSGAAGAAIGGDPALETVGAVDGPAHG